MQSRTEPQHISSVYPPIIIDTTIWSDDQTVTKLTTVNAYGKTWRGVHKRSRVELHKMIHYSIIQNT